MYDTTQQQSKQTAMIPLTDKEKKQTTTAVIVHFGLNSVNSVSAVVAPGSMGRRVGGGGGEVHRAVSSTMCLLGA